MEATIKSADWNPLVNRTELEVELEHEGEATPERSQVIDRISAEQNLDKEDIVVESIYTGFGDSVSEADLKVSGEPEIEALETSETGNREPGEHYGSEGEPAEGTADYEEIVSGTIKDAKKQLKELNNPDYQKALQAEQKNKNRTTFTEWLEERA